MTAYQSTNTVRQVSGTAGEGGAVVARGGSGRVAGFAPTPYRGTRPAPAAASPAADRGGGATAADIDATIGVLGLPVIQIGVVQSSSQSMCTGTAGAVTIASVTVGGVLVNVGVHPGPNTTVTVAGITLIFNEESPVPGADQGLTVNAIHIKAAPIGLGLLDVTLASATSDIHNC